MSYAPSTPVEVILHLGELTRELDRLTTAYCQAEEQMVHTKHAYELARAHAYLESNGTVDARNAQVVIVCDDQRLGAEIAESVVRQVKQRIRTLENRIDVGRTFGATVRAEMKTLDYAAGA